MLALVASTTTAFAPPHQALRGATRSYSTSRGRWATSMSVIEDATRSTTLEATSRWLQQSGGVLGSARAVVAPSGQGLGLETTQAVRRGDELLRTPAPLAITAETALRSDIGQYIAEFEPQAISLMPLPALNCCRKE